MRNWLKFDCLQEIQKTFSEFNLFKLNKQHGLKKVMDQQTHLIRKKFGLVGTICGSLLLGLPTASLASPAGPTVVNPRFWKRNVGGIA